METQQTNTENSTTEKTGLYNDPLMEQYIELKLNTDTPVSVSELWEKAKHLYNSHTDDNSSEAFIAGEACEMAHRDPKFNPSEMLLKIQDGVRMGFTQENWEPIDEIHAYRYAAEAVANIAENNHSSKEVTTTSLLVLNNMQKECLNFEETFAKANPYGEERLQNQIVASEIMNGYAKVGYDTPVQAKNALDKVAQLSKVYSGNTVETAYSIVNKSESSPDVAESAFKLLNGVKPNSSDEASKMLKLYKNISLDNPELAEASVQKMLKIFKDFPSDEKLQKECLSTLQSLNGFRGKFDEDTQKKIDSFSKTMKNHIDAQTIQRAQGKPTTWTQPSSTAGNANSNQPTNDDERSAHKEETFEEMITRYSGRNTENQTDRSKRWEKEYSDKSENKTKQFNIDIDFGYER